MKKLLLLPIFFALITFTGCKDDEPNPNVETALDKELKGEWSNYQMVAVYVDGQDQVAHTDTSKAEVIHTFNKPNMKIYHTVSKSEATVNYALPDTSATRYIVLTNDLMEQHVYEIKSLTDTDMVWERVVRYASYK
uniref:hypothetical protein n=1 Tax=Pontibacter sp. 13R65 TaxID=3127458 RepID=UPI00301CCD26